MVEPALKTNVVDLLPGSTEHSVWQRGQSPEQPDGSQEADQPSEHSAKDRPEERSLFRSFRNRIFREDQAADIGETAPQNADEPSTESASPLTDGQESALPRIEDRLNPGAAAHGRPHPFRSLDAPLEAPTPLSAITRKHVAPAIEPFDQTDDGQVLKKTAAVDKQIVAESESAERMDEEDGFVHSLFNVFGIGGERNGRRISDQPGTLRRTSMEQLQRPPVDSDEAPNSIDVSHAPLQTVHWQEELDRLTALLETQLAHQSPGDSAALRDYYLRQHVALRLLYLIGSRKAEALQVIPDCDPSQQEFWTELLWALSNYFDEEAMAHPSERARQTAARLRAALEHIAPQAGLQLSHCVFCRRIDGYGSYASFQRDEFLPGQAVLIYAEIQNFHSQITPQGEFLTTLQSTLTIHEGDLSGPVVFREELPQTEDRCRSRRRDYFHSYRIKLPSTLAAGPHVLKLTVVDPHNQNQGGTTLNFVVR